MPEQNLISADLSDADAAAVMTALQTLDAKLPMLLGLTPQERQELQKMGDTRRAFVQKTLEVARQHPQIFPATFDLPEFERDMALFLKLLPLFLAFQTRFEKLGDTVLALGSDLYAEALDAYAYIRQAGRSAGLDELRAQLKSSRQRAPRPAAGSTPAPRTP